MEEEHSKSTRKTLKAAELDKISYLPGHVINQILSHLPIKEAVRTSVLSRKWSNKWYTLPNLVFDEHCVLAAASQNPSVIKDKFLRIVDHVLLLHRGPINKFEICNQYYNILGASHTIDIDRWILHLIGRSIKELVLDISYFFMKQHYKIPWRLFSCQSLQHLELNFCCLKPPMTFEGFRNLKSLDLNNVKMTQDDFENLISSSPLLEKLILNNLDGFKQINIHGPNLKVFDFLGDFEDISFHNTFKLSELIVYLYPGHIQGRLHECNSNLLQFFVNLPHIQRLEIHHSFLKYLATGVVPVNLPTPCIDLRSLCLRINFDDSKELSAALCLLKSSPNLQKLHIIAATDLNDLLTPTSCWENMFSEPTMPIHVRHVRIYGISGFKSELDFIRFLLLYSPVLEKMIVRSHVNVKLELMNELVRFKRASGQSEVIYEVYNSPK